jgi:nitrogen fixation-related uncharacterized protein
MSSLAVVIGVIVALVVVIAIAVFWTLKEQKDGDHTPPRRV